MHIKRLRTAISSSYLNLFECFNAGVEITLVASETSVAFSSLHPATLHEVVFISGKTLPKTYPSSSSVP